MIVGIDLLILNYMVFNKLYRRNLNKEDREMYDRVKKLRHGELDEFIMDTSNKTGNFSWKIKKEIVNEIEIVSCYGKAILIDKSYSFIFVPEYDDYQSKISNFDYMLIYVLNWYYDCLDKYLKIISRKKKLIEIEQNYY